MVGGEEFHRNPDLPGLNAFLNYGYAVMRAAVARVGGGRPTSRELGIQHHNRSNAFCLADDLMEPLRPFVDLCVRDLRNEGIHQLTQPAKARLLQLLSATVRMGAGTPAH